MSEYLLKFAFSKFSIEDKITLLVNDLKSFHTYKKYLNEDELKLVYNRLNNPTQIDEYGNLIWTKNGKLHNENGPAKICIDGTKIYCYEGEFHNKVGPAIIYPNGTIHHYFNGKRHNPFGPAVVYSDGRREYWFNDTQYKSLRDIINDRFPLCANYNHISAQEAKPWYTFEKLKY